MLWPDAGKGQASPLHWCALVGLITSFAGPLLGWANSAQVLPAVKQGYSKFGTCC